MKKIKALAVALFCCMSVYGQNVVPKPVSITVSDLVYTLARPIYIHYETKEEAPLASYLAEYLPVSFSGAIPPVSYYPRGSYIYLYINPGMDLPAEGYRLEVLSESVTVTGKDYGGLFNGIQTFLQLLPPEVYKKEAGYFNWTVGGVTIEDYPRFSYRGQMLDIVRTFIPKEELLRQIDYLAYHKINKLHWHLTDDEGWRIEIKSYPKLAEVGGFRGGDSPVRPIYGAWDRKYGGYYTQDDVREVVAYAAVRNIEVIPEIELPGHSRTAAIVYPEIVCDYTPYLTSTGGYDRRNLWCVAKESNYEILDRIIAELSELFPSEYIHLGGDEVETGQWSQCPHCKALMKEKGIKEAAGLEDVFMEKVVAIAAKYGRKAVVWNEAVSSGKLDRSTMVSGWKNIAACRMAAAAGYPTVVIPGKYFYFDMRQSQNETGHIWAGIVPPELVYSFDFGKEGFTAAEMKNVRGIEATFFSELLLSQGLDFLDYQLYPRICALSELTWTPQADRSWNDFKSRLSAAHYERMRAMGIGFRTEKDADNAGNMVAASPRKTPAVAFTSSLKEAAKYPYSKVSTYKGMARSSITCGEGDWFLFEFTAPLTCNTIRIATGYEHLPKAGIPAGRVEISYDGTNFEKAADLHDLGAVINPARSLKAIKIISKTKGNGESFVIIQPLDIR